ncbi:hypothetical protein IM774_11745 [Erysipelotrichaceae bacterium RD49]|nr:hypothetical protein [Erysipelotrichaceae bacterium RD49]
MVKYGIDPAFYGIKIKQYNRTEKTDIGTPKISRPIRIENVSESAKPDIYPKTF